MAGVGTTNMWKRSFIKDPVPGSISQNSIPGIRMRTSTAGKADHNTIELAEETSSLIIGVHMETVGGCIVDTTTSGYQRDLYSCS